MLHTNRPEISENDAKNSSSDGSLIDPRGMLSWLEYIYFTICNSIYMQAEEWEFNVTYKNVEILDTTLTNRNCIHDEVKSRLNSGTAGHQWVQSLIFSPLTPKN
jgi:hypothetical protein